MFVGKHIANCCVNCGEEFNCCGLQVYVINNKQFCSLNCLHQYKREDLLPQLNSLEVILIDSREEMANEIALTKFLIKVKENPNISLSTFNSRRSNGKADAENAEELLMFLTKKHQIYGTRILMVKNIKARNSSAYRIFKEKYQEQYEEYIAITKNSEQRREESEYAMRHLKVMEICERHFI